MNPEETIALSFVPVTALMRGGLAARLREDDPTLVELARRHLPAARAARQAAHARGISAVAWCDPDYPQSLLTLEDFPPALWYRGDIRVVTGRVCVAIVGSRTASPTSLDMAARLGADLASAGVVVVSGLARGVDSAAHRGALTTGLTVAVLGSGVDTVYPAEHEGLASRVAGHGVVLSELPPGVPPLAYHFPLRNRLISGLSRAVVVVEAAEKSGSLITAGYALNQGREVLAVPGAVAGGRNRGAHALIRDGAKIVESADDIVCELGTDLQCPTPPSSEVSPVSSMSSGDTVANAMVPDVRYELDELRARTGLDTPALLVRLADLELAGSVRRLAGGCFMRPVRTC